MQKQQIIGFVLITLIVFLYLGVIVPKYTPQPKPVPKGAISKDTTALSAVSTDTTQTTTKTIVSTDSTLLSKAQEITINTDLYHAKFTTLGGRLTSFQLKKIAIEKFMDSVPLEEQLKQAIQKNDGIQIELLQTELNKFHTQQDLIKKENEAKKQNDTAKVKEYADQLAGLDWVELVSGNENLAKPLELDFSGIANADKTTLYSFSTNDLTLDAKNPKGEITLKGVLSNGLVVEKAISFTNDNYILPVNLQVTNSSDKEIRLSEDGVGMSLHVGEGIGDLQLKSQSRYDLGPQATIKMDNAVSVLSLTTTETKRTGKIDWASIQTNYFFKGLVPQISSATSLEARLVPNGRIYIPSLTLEIPTLDLPAKDIIKQSYLFYIGPKQSEKLTALNVPVEDILFYHWSLFSWLKTLDYLILTLLKWFYSITKNYGVAIIIISLLFKVVTFPLTHISFKSMKAMQLLAPEMKKLQEKFKDDPARQQKETMALYKKHKVNPVAGCLPMLIQMPILFSFYAVLGKAIELRGAHFIWWITDLSKPDTVAYIAGFSINILPILMAATQWVQQKMAPATPDPKNAMMGQMMTFVMLFIFWNMASGLVLYWFISNILSILQQHYINKQAIPVHLPHAHSEETK